MSTRMECFLCRSFKLDYPSRHGSGICKSQDLLAPENKKVHGHKDACPAFYLMVRWINEQQEALNRGKISCNSCAHFDHEEKSVDPCWSLTNKPGTCVSVDSAARGGPQSTCAEGCGAYLPEIWGSLGRRYWPSVLLHVIYFVQKMGLASWQDVAHAIWGEARIAVEPELVQEALEELRRCDICAKSDDDHYSLKRYKLNFLPEIRHNEGPHCGSLTRLWKRTNAWELIFDVILPPQVGCLAQPENVAYRRLYRHVQPRKAHANCSACGHKYQ